MNQITPHPTRENISLSCAVITVSDTRTQETDKSGNLLQEILRSAGHFITVYQIIKDEKSAVVTQMESLSQRQDIDALIFNGGTGIAPRDTTYDAIENLLEKTLPGFGEIFRWLSYQEIGSRAIASRAVAGTYQGKLIFSLPGSTNAVKLAVEKLILPELVHLVLQLRKS
ncbi:MAG: molybdenum cofactor biosynthesis protein B [Trichodesmium sp.]